MFDWLNRKETIVRPTINLGDQVRDRVTGYTGIVIAFTQWLNGCNRVTVQAQELKDGKPVDCQAFDVEQMEVLKANALDLSQKPSGGPMPSPQRASDPTR